MENRIRLAAKKVKIDDLVRGKYVAGIREEMKPGYVITPFGQKISRVNIIATITEKFLSEDENYGSLTLDDGTESIRAKVFRDDISLIRNLNIGDMVIVIGRIKEFNGETYVNAEIVNKTTDFNYEQMRKLEILNELFLNKKIFDEIKNMCEEVPDDELKDYAKNNLKMDDESFEFILQNIKSSKPEIDYKPKLLEVISSLDSGEGAEISKILEVSNLPQNVIEDALNNLLDLGLIFEPKPGILKRV